MAGKPLIVILGATAVGKTGTAIRLAERVNGEIIGADSRQIYRYMDIGTAKPTPAEQARVPHHLIDLVNPDENLTLAHYQRLAYATIDRLHRDGKIPLLVGGTGQYLTAVTEGWSIPEVPPNDALRAELEAYAETRGTVALHQRLAAVDPEVAERTHPNNVRRVIRSLEVYLETGTPISELQRKKPPPYSILELGLTLERPLLNERAEKRVDQMLAAGFLDEVRQLLKIGYAPELPSMSGLGYKELASYLCGELTLQEAVTETKTATRQFIRRQETWFRGHDNGILWHNETTDLINTAIRWLDEHGFTEPT